MQSSSARGPALWKAKPGFSRSKVPPLSLLVSAGGTVA